MVQYKRPEKESANFRDSLATIDDTGKRLWVYAKKPKGRLTNYRQILAYILIALLFAGPFLKINGETRNPEAANKDLTESTNRLIIKIYRKKDEKMRKCYYYSMDESL